MAKIKKHSVVSGVAHIMSGFNNIIVSITDNFGNVLTNSSSGKMGLRGSKKATDYAGKLVAEDAARNVISIYNTKTVYVVMLGSGPKEGAVKGLRDAGLIISSISDRTPTVHNGCRSKKKRRL